MIEEHLPPSEEFIERLGLIFEADGLPRIAGRMLGLFLVEGGPFRFDELADRLQVSRGSVSTATRRLETQGFIERFTVPGERRDIFRLSADPYARLLGATLERLRQVQTVVDNCRGQLDAEDGRERLAAMSRFYSIAISNTESTLHDWHRPDPQHDLASSAEPADGRGPSTHSL